MYAFHVDQESGDLVSDHFGEPADDFTHPTVEWGGWHEHTRREFPDLGRGDVRLPAIHIAHTEGDTVTALTYQSHEILDGKPPLRGLPATFGNEQDVSSLRITLHDNISDVSAVLLYSVFPKQNAIVRSFELTNHGPESISILRASSFSTDLPNLDLEMIELHGDHVHEANKVRRKVEHGETGFRSTEGYSSHLYNPFFALVSPTTTETTGSAWGFNLVYTGSFEAMTERFSTGFVRVLLGMNPLHAGIPVQPGSTFTSPEVVSVFSSEGLGGMSRSFHDLYRNHLSRSKYTFETRPVLLNSWEGHYFDINETVLHHLFEETAELGISLFVTDDGWFGQAPLARVNDTAGLGDWSPNPDHFPNGFDSTVEAATNISVANSSENLRFGLWFEPEMVNPNSSLYQEHPDWALHAKSYHRTLFRDQLVLNVGLPEVQDYIIKVVSDILSSVDISYVKWDNNRAMHEMPNPAAAHNYMIGLYRVIDTLTTRFPDVLWEGCASGGGRFDAGLLHYWPQHWTSDNTDAVDRLSIQLGTSLAYPMSSMGCHVSAVPNGLTQRNTSITYRAHVALMCGSFGFELDTAHLTSEERAAIPNILSDSEKINPIVISGDFYRLRLPDESNWPAVQFVSADAHTAFVLAFQQHAVTRPVPPPLRLQALEPTARYSSNLYNGTFSGRSLMNGGLDVQFEMADYQSRLIWLWKLDST